MASTWDAILDQIELLFDLSQQSRTGYIARGVPEEKSQRMIGHIGLVGIASLWINVQFKLGLDEALLAKLSFYHDLAKAHDGDSVRVKVEDPKRPWSVAASVISRLVKKGHSKRERQEELAKAMDALSPYMLGQTSEISSDVSMMIQLYFLREGQGKDEARFVFDIGQIIDVHAALWYGRSGDMNPSRFNVRSFTYQLRKRIKHRTAKLYWIRVRHRYLELMLPAYDNSLRKALSQ